MVQHGLRIIPGTAENYEAFTQLLNGGQIIESYTLKVTFRHLRILIV